MHIAPLESLTGLFLSHDILREGHSHRLMGQLLHSLGQHAKSGPTFVNQFLWMNLESEFERLGTDDVLADLAEVNVEIQVHLREILFVDLDLLVCNIGGRILQLRDPIDLE